jgi:hypothetical protein
MLTLLGSPRRCCDGLTRRETLRAGALALLGGLFGQRTPGRAATARLRRNAQAKSVIVLYLLGGAATQDMFDLKPDAASGVRSLFKPIPTSAAGVSVCEHLPRLARWMHKAALVRSVNHKAGCHNCLPSYTGYGEPPPNGAADATQAQDSFPPSMGSVCEYLRASAGRRPDAGLPAYVYLPCYLGWGQAFRRLGPYAGFLGRRYDPLFTECKPTAEGASSSQYQPRVVRGEPRLPDLELPQGLTLDRLERRRALSEQFDDQLRASETRGEFDKAERGALTLLTSKRVRDAFDLGRVPPALRDRYGPTLFGQSALMARQLVEEGVQFVNVTWDIYWERPSKLDGVGWDTHQRNFEILKDINLPYLDRAYSALMADLHARGLLDETLVVLMSEMGRTPKVNNTSAGRDHWTFCYSVLLAGAGIKGGTVHGASDAQAAYVKDKPVSPADICATIYECLGIDPELQVHDASDRPFAVAQGGKPIREILA